MDDTLQVGTISHHKNWLVGGFNPSEKYSSNWIISPSRGEHKKKNMKPPVSWEMSEIKLAKSIPIQEYAIQKVWDVKIS